MQFRNTTNIPDKLVALAFWHGKQGLGDIELDTLIVKNKAKGKVNGRWGWYYHSHPKYGRCVVIIVPRSIHKPVRIKRRILGNIAYYLNSRSDFLVKVMAHELRHAYQYQVAGKMWAPTKWLEQDCHKWEFIKLIAWRKMLQQKAADHS